MSGKPAVFAIRVPLAAGLFLAAACVPVAHEEAAPISRSRKVEMVKFTYTIEATAEEAPSEDRGYLFDPSVRFVSSPVALPYGVLGFGGGSTVGVHQPWGWRHVVENYPGVYAVTARLGRQLVGEGRFEVCPDGTVEPEVVKIVLHPVPGTVRCRLLFDLGGPAELDIALRKKPRFWSYFRVVCTAEGAENAADRSHLWNTLVDGLGESIPWIVTRATPRERR
ncbi:MAG: hypothetical protein ACYSU0_23055 [Planctomycetota bacterium]